MKARYYNTSFTSSKAYHNNGNTTRANHFFIETMPELANETALTNPGGWGERFYFSVNVTG